MSPALQATLLRAREYAAGQAHREVALEHLLLALSEDEDAAAVMHSCQVDLARLRNDVAGYLGSLGDRAAPGQQPAIAAALTQILKYATLAAKQGRRPRIDGAIVLAAIVGDGKSMAASFLKAQGLTFEQAVRVLQQAIREGARAPAALPQPPPAARPAASVAPVPVVSDARLEQVQGVSPPSSRATGAEDILAAARARVETRVVTRPPQLIPRELAEPVPEEQLLAHEARQVADVPRLPSQPPVLDAAPVPALDPHYAATETTPWPVEPSQPDENQPAPWPEEPPPVRSPFTPPPAPSSWAPPAAPPPSASPASPFPAARPPLPPLMPLSGGPPRLPATQATAPQTQAARPSPPPWGAPPERRPPSPPPTQRTGPQALQPSLPQATPSQAPPSPPESFAPGPPQPRSPAIELSQLSHSVPARLTVGRARTVEVQINRQPLGSTGGASRPAPQREDIVTARAISVRLRPAKGRFLIDQPSTETQWDKASDGSRLAGEAAVWRFTLHPLAEGAGELLLTASARTIAANGMILETTLPDQVIAVRVGRDWSRMMRVVGTLALVALGSVALKEIFASLFHVDLATVLKAIVR
ncbi:MAG: Clp protease N-terminal domain-containing protein [Hyphomicrobiaceae bacterium]